MMKYFSQLLIVWIMLFFITQSFKKQKNTYDVELICVPNGKVSYIPLLDFELAERNGNLPDWKTPASREANLIGQYKFKIEFFDFPKSEIIEAARVTKNGKIIFTRDGIKQ